MRRFLVRLAVASAVVCLTTASGPPSRTDRPTRKIGSMKLLYAGLSATVDPLNPVVPKNVPAGVRIVIRAGGAALTPDEAEQFFGGPFEVQGELSGPGLTSTRTLVTQDDPLLLPLPALSPSGDYLLSNLRVVVDGKLALDVSPRQVAVRVIEQVLITSVKTRALTLDELKEKGVVIDGDDLLGFEFTLGMTLESKPVNITFPVVFDRQGVAVPQPLSPPPVPGRTGVSLDLPPLPTIVPMMLEPEGELEFPDFELPDGTKEEVRIPSVLVIPGDVGFLKQFFEAKLFVANGAPGLSRLTVRDIKATIELPPGPDQVLGTADDPLALPELTTGTQAKTLPVRGVGPDGEAGTTDDTARLAPGEQGQTEFLVRGESEGYHPLAFDIGAVLDGLATGPLKVKGRAAGGVLVRNPFFNVSFTVPSVVRAQEPFKLFVTVHNIGKGPANRVDVSFNDRGLSGLELAPGAEASQRIDTLLSGESATLAYEFVALRTGQLVATYLRFDGEPAADGQVHFTLGVDERGVPLSPDTLVLPTSVNALAPSVLNAAMRVLGQGWGVANSRRSILPPDVLPIPKNVIIEKAIALAEAGLRVELGESDTSAVRNLTFDLYGGAPINDGFNQLLSSTTAGAELRSAIVAELEPAIAGAGGVVAYERETALIAASGRDFLTYAVDSASIDVVPDAAKGAVALKSETATLGIVTALPSSPYTLALEPRTSGSASLSLTLPRGDGSFVRGTASFDYAAGDRARLVADRFRPEHLAVELDANADGIFETTVPLALETFSSAGPTLVSATIIGPERLSGASAFGFHAAALFDRVVDEGTADDVERYSIPDNALKGAKRQLSGRLVLLTLARPEGPHVDTTLDVADIADLRGVRRSSSVPFSSLLEDAGAVVGGRVFHADGRPVTTGSIAYANYRGSDDCTVGQELVFADVPLDVNGGYALHYVRRDPCGSPFRVLYRSTTSPELRDVSSFVRTDGERIVLDLALLGRGAVTGIVSEGGVPAPGSQVVVISGTDPQSGGVTTTDGDGRYTVHDVVVGPVSVKAARGPAVGSSSGRIARAGTTATVDLVLDPGKISVRGTVSKLEKGITTTVPRVPVVYSLFVPSRTDPLPMGVTRTAPDGTYLLEELPFGSFRLEAILDTNARASIQGSAVPGQNLVENLIIPIAAETELGTVRGRVRLPDVDGTGVEGALVRVGSRAVVSGTDGAFELTGVPVKPGQIQQVLANDAKRLRQGQASVVVSLPGQIVDGVVITLSGLGSAEFTVKSQNGDPLGNQLVGLLGSCANLCGCRFGTTDPGGRVTFADLPAGTVFAKAVLVGTDFVDVATGSARIEGDGKTGFGLLQFEGVGSVDGLVFLPGGVDPAVAADVVLTSRVFNRDACELRTGISHRGRTDSQGKFAFSHVNFGQVSATATHPFADRRVGATANLTKATPVSFTLELVDTTAGVLSGTVFLPDGVTPAGAGVEVSAIGPLPEVRVRTDDNGRYEFAPIFPQGMYTVTVTDAVTGGIAQERLFLRADADLLHDFRLKGRGTVRVRVVDAAGVPVDNAFVRLTEQEFPRGELEGVIEPSNQGVLTFSSVFEGPFSVDVRDVAARGGRLASVLPGPGRTVEVVVRLNAVGTVKGHFLLPDGKPIAFGVVKLLSSGRVLAQATTAGSGDVGAFTFDFVPVGPVRLEAQDPLTARGGFVTGEIQAEGDTLALDVTAKGLGRVEGNVTASGFVPDGAHVYLVSGSFRACTTADTTGFYFIDGVPEGQVVLTASLGSGFLSGTAADALIGDGTTLELDVALRESALVAGTVMTAVSLDPAPPSLVTISVGGVGGGTQSTITDPVDGTFRFEQVPAGLATINVQTLGGLDRARRTIDVLPAQPTNVLIPLNGVGAVEVFAETASGTPTAGKLTLRGTGDFPYTFVIALADDGHVLLPEVLAGPVTATLVVDGSTRLYGTTTGLVLPGGTLLMTVRTEPSGRVRGIAQGSGSPAVGATVLVELSGNRGVIATQTDIFGGFDVSGVPFGEVDIRVEDPFSGGVGLLRGLVLSDTEPFLDGLVVDLDASPVRVVSVEPPDGTIDVPIDQPVRVHFSDPVQALNNAVTLRAGSSFVSGVAALAPDGLSATIAASLPDSKTLTVTVSTSLVDVFGRRPQSVFTSTFRTVDLSPPMAIATDPADAAFEVGPRPIVLVTFDEPLSDVTDFGGLIALEGPGGTVPGVSERASVDGGRFTPSADLADNAIYAVVVNGAVDELGNTQTSPRTVSRFATADSIAPVLAMLSPPANAWLAQVRPSLQLTMTDNASGIDPTSASFSLDDTSVTASVSGDRLIHTPSEDLGEGTHTIEAGVLDRAGNAGSFSGAFHIDVTPPSQALLTSPAPGSVLNGTVHFSATATDAPSGVARIEVRRNGSLFTSLLPPTFEADLPTSILPEGDGVLTARAVDRAGNTGPVGEDIPIRVDNDPLRITILQPPANARVRDSVTVAATASEPVSRIDFTVGSVSVSDDTSPYQATLDLTPVAEGVQTITATGFGLLGDVAAATRDVTIDRTPPLPPDPDLVFAEPPEASASLVHGLAEAVEANAKVDAVNLSNLATASTNAGANGSFALSVVADVGDVVSLVATDDLGNESGASQTVVRAIPSLPPPESRTRLAFDGVLVDRVGPGASDLTPDGELDAVFSVELEIGDGVTRTLSSIELAGPLVRSTEASVGASLGVSRSAGGPLENGVGGEVAFDITSADSLTLFASDFGFVEVGATYTVKVVFTDRAEFVATTTILPAADARGIPHSLRIVAADSPVLVPAGTSATTTLTIDDIRDIEGTPVPDGARVAVSVHDMATVDPFGNPVRSAGGLVLEGEPAANDARFRIFTVSGGSITVPYDTGVVVPEPVIGANVVVTALAADESGNVLGNETIGTLDLNLRAADDRALVTVDTSSLYADKAARRRAFTVVVRDAFGTPLPDGTKVLLSATHCAARNNGTCVASFGGSVIGSLVSAPTATYQIFETAGGNGSVTAEYELPMSKLLAPGATDFVAIQVNPATPTGGLASQQGLGTALIPVVGPGGAEIDASPAAIPLVRPEPSVQVRVRHVHDMRGNLLPDDAKIIVSAQPCATRIGSSSGPCAFSDGGAIVDGEPSGTGASFRVFSLGGGFVNATYRPTGISAGTGQVKIGGLQVAMADAAGLRPSQIGIAYRAVPLLAPGNAVGMADPPYLLADGRLRTTRVTFKPVLDAFGNPVPDGTRLLASAAANQGRLDGKGIPSVFGAQILNGEVASTFTRVFNVENEAVHVELGVDNVLSAVGVVQKANVVLLIAGPTDNIVDQEVLGVVPVPLPGITSATATASPTMIEADGSDRRAVITISNLRDALGNPVPDGVRIALTTVSCGTQIGPDCIRPDVFPAVLGGEENVAFNYETFTVRNGQVVAEISTQGLSVSSGSRTAIVQVALVRPNNTIVSPKEAVATVEVELVPPGSDRVAMSPVDLFADSGPTLSQVAVSLGSVANSQQVALTVADCAAEDITASCVPSAGGTILTAGTSPGDGVAANGDARFRLFTVTGGGVAAVYSAEGQAAGVSETRVARVSVVPTDGAGNVASTTALATGEVRLRGMTSAVSSGPAALPLSGGEATITFSGIRDSIGNTVPDGTLVFVTTADGATRDEAGDPVASVGGTLAGGNVYATAGGAVSVSYSTLGATPGIARIQITPAQSDGTPIGDRSLLGGVHEVSVGN